MELPDVIDSIELAPAGFAEFYIKGEDGKFKFDPATSVAGLKKNKTDILSEKTRLEERFKGVDIDEYNRLKAAEKKIADDKLAATGDWDAKEKSIRESLGTIVKEKETTVAKLTTALEKNLIQAAAVSAISAADGIQETLEVHIIRHIKMVEVNGDFVARVIGPDGQVRYAGGAEMTIDQLVAEYKANPKFAGCFTTKKASGTGGPSNGQDRKPGATVTEGSILNPTERLKLSRRQS